MRKLLMLFQAVILATGLSLLPLPEPAGHGVARTPRPAAASSLQKRVVIDPGHGGRDAGVKGPAGTLEKEVTLRLARLLGDRLKDRFKVTLTRNDDYQLSRSDRTGQANHLRADLFISIHAAGSYSPATGGLCIWTYAEPETKIPPRPRDEEAGALPWRELQKRHTPASTALGKYIRTRAASLTKTYGSTVEAAPAAVLAGADMPAILIEAGYLTNPKQEKNLNDPKYLFKLANAISLGIDDYFDHAAGKP